MGNVYNTLYHVTCAIWVGQEYKTIHSSDIISIALIHRYDIATYPIIRFRIYADMSLVELINEDPNNITITCNMDGGIYRTDDSDDIRIIRSVPSIRFSAKAYIENKNIPVSKMDQYKMGERDTNDLNVDSKVPFELYAYNDTITHSMKQKTPAVYRNVCVETVARDLLKRIGIPQNHLSIDPIHNQKRYDQIVIPNLSTIEAFTFFDRYYGLYHHGGMLYYDFTQETMYLCDSSVHNQTTTVPIYVRTEKYNSDESGMFKSSDSYWMQSNAMNVSVLSESDVARVLTPEIISDINVNTLDVSQTEMKMLFDTTNIDTLQNRIEQKNILHKSDRKTLSIQQAARINEQITHIDVSGAGFPIHYFNPRTRINLVFESPIRGLKLADAYRPKYVCHVLTNASGTFFVTQTTMELCTN